MDNTQMQLSDFSKRLPYPCHLEHDSKAAADLELWNHPQFDSALIFLLNPNLGGAIITNHEVHQGSHMRSGLIEHICIDPDGPECYCGGHGCLETERGSRNASKGILPDTPQFADPDTGTDLAELPLTSCICDP